MILARTRPELESALRELRKKPGALALVPTMGSLHEGHLSLFDRAARDAGSVVASVFVNPLQFDRLADLDAYPRDLEQDLILARERGASLVFAPSMEDMYPEGSPDIAVDPGPMGDRMEGAFRPGHFRGVLTVVAKLFHLVRPDQAVFGAKDLQQGALVCRMVRDLDFPVEVLLAPTVRESDGLAMSSRNVRLSESQRRAASALSRALGAGVRAVAAGERAVAGVLEVMEAVLDPVPAVSPEYIEIVDPQSLEPLETVTHGAVAAIAAHVGPVRLIDNMVLWEG